MKHVFDGPVVNGEHICRFCSCLPREAQYALGMNCEKRNEWAKTLLDPPHPEWDEPLITSNCALMSGMMAAEVLDGYKLVSVQPGLLIIEHGENGNRYTINIEQISGVE